MPRIFLILAVLAVCLTSTHAFAQPSKQLQTGASFDVELKPSEAHSYSVSLKRGESARILVHQQGADLVVRVRSPQGTLLEEVDSPTGRIGTEVVEVLAGESGTYGVEVLPFSDQEPAAKYKLEVVSILGTQATAELLAGRRQVRNAATDWLKPQSVGIESPRDLAQDLPPVRRLAERVRVLGIGEATHGSRELNDARLALTRRLVEKHGYRIVALEGSVDRLRLLEPYVNGNSPLTPEISRLLASGIWIGMRSRRELVEWIRGWNLQHPDDRVRIVGVDPQDAISTHQRLGTFLARAYGDDVRKRWQSAESELKAADEQSLVFGDSSVDPLVRQFLMEITAMLELDSALLTTRYGTRDVQAARDAAHELLEFSDFNGREGSTISHSRDWYMAARVLAALDQAGPQSHAVYWAHNAHVAHVPGSMRTTGSVLRSVLGCQYGALALTFGEGTVLAQMPNDAEDRLAVTALPAGPEESIESVLSALHEPGAVASWACDVEEASTPKWLQIPRNMHWVGGLHAPNSLPSAAFRSFNLLQDFDGIGYVRRTTAEEIPSDRPVIPARKK